MSSNVRYDQLDGLESRALDAAEQVMERAYNPYSHFYVGAALFGDDGTIVTGTNFESANYSSICAERAAIVSANSQGIRRFRGVAVIGRGENFATAEVVSPCGVCRQMLYEVSQLSKTDMQLILSSTKKDKIVRATIAELLPIGFGPIDVGVNIENYNK